MNQIQLPEPNLPLLRKCVEWAIAESKKPVLESEWDQRWFRLVGPGCKTAYCIAGYACEVSGGQWHPSLLSYLIADNNDNHNDVWIDRNIISPGDRARHLLGLTDEEAAMLFSESNTIEDVCRIANQIAARAGERL